MATSLEDAEERLSEHVGDAEVNQTQILIVLGEAFTAKALAICDYLNRSSGEANYSVEFWKYALYPLKADTGDHILLLEQVLPPPSVRQEIEEKRAAAKTKKYARDRTRIDFMHQLVDYFMQKGISVSGSQGQPYSRKIDVAGHDVVFQVQKWGSYPWIDIPDALELPADIDLPSRHLNKGSEEPGVWYLEFSDIDSNNLKFDQSFGDHLIEIIGKLKLHPNQSPPSALNAVGTDDKR